jgi:hypothetical protein
MTMLLRKTSLVLTTALMALATTSVIDDARAKSGKGQQTYMTITLTDSLVTANRRAATALRATPGRSMRAPAMRGIGGARGRR